MLAELDPKLFHLDWDQTGEALAAIVVLAFFVERALSLFFENRKILEKLSGTGMKEFIALGVSFVICWVWDFDALAIILSGEKNTIIGYLVTAGVIAGGSKAAIKLFHDLMGFKSSALKEREQSKSGEAAKKPLEMRKTVWSRVESGIGDKKKVGDDARPLIEGVVEKIVINAVVSKADKKRIEEVAWPAVDRWAAAMAPAGSKTTVGQTEFLAGVPQCKGWPFEPETK